MQFTVPKGDLQKADELLTLIKKYASKYDLESNNEDGDVYKISFKDEEDEDAFKVQSIELLRMNE
ncbi:hypothetical protein AM493_02570 [Flavobacterium akiainvivens]|uniref:Uncharacterized protein n=1 Tax=Flavobacterium akiainvivens TaxID=1202724 RepID=A0A0M8MF99_9FLAO|nr:hypothetical protein [Flavobacterium akiainvivens]KOS05041.1 hypothetical protein AM493_02570 [Flavobacterium akiainvivens]SFQ39811.1 hypothetical protein SAMN05444144_1043 [Flavobacterium akiainvivens]